MNNLILKREGESSYVTWIKKRIKNNLNLLAIATGPVGVGKSFTMMSLAEQIDPDFSVNQIAFDFKQLMNIINDPEFHKRKWKIVLFDEAEISMSNRNWQSLNNKLINYLLSTFRHQNIILLFTAPYSDFLDSASMKLIHCEFRCVGVNRKTELSRVRPLILEYNPNVHKTYRHCLYVCGQKQRPKALRDWFVQKPSQDLIDKYEQKKKEFTQQLNKEILIQLEESTKGSSTQLLAGGTKQKSLTPIQEKVMKACAECGSVQKAAVLLGMSLSSVYTDKKWAEKKGYTVEDFKPKPEGNNV